MKKVKIFTIITVFALCILSLGIFLSLRYSYKITYDLNGGDKSNNKSLVWHNDSLKLNTPTKYGYTFTGWEDKYGEPITELKNIKSDITVHATWELNPEYYGELPVIEITTKYNTQPDSKKDYVDAKLNMFNCPDEDHNLEDKDIGIRLRGNSTMRYDKKPYRIKFDKKTSVLGMEKNKSWVLLADYLDQSSIRNYTAFNIAQQMENLPFANEAHHVVLTMNGKYQGLYLLTQQIDENDGRTGVEEDFDPTIDTSFPFLVEVDRNAHNEGITGVDNFETPFYPCEIKYPEADERNLAEGQEDVVFNYIRDYINASFEALKNGTAIFNGKEVTFDEMVDVDSFIEFWLINEVMYNSDSSWGSIYMCKTKDGKMKFGPVWDFDWSMSSIWTDKPFQVTQLSLATQPYLLTNGSMLDYFIKDQSNYNLVCEKWNAIKNNILSVCNKLIEYQSTITPIAKQDAVYWYSNSIYSKYMMPPEVQVETQYDYVVEFLLTRIDYLSSILTQDNYENLAK